MQLLKRLWQAVDFCRRLFLNILFLGLLAAAAALWMFSRPSAPAVAPGSLLVLDLAGTVAESDPLQSVSAEIRMLLQDKGSVTRLIDLTEALRIASQDPDIAGVVIETRDLAKLGMASAHTLGQALENYKKATGKPVLAWGTNFTQAQYAAAAHADILALHPMGSIMIKGLSGTAVYWGGLLEKLGIGVSVFKAGDFKSAPEVFSRSSPSPENLLAQQSYLDEAWKVFSGELEAARGMVPGAIAAYLEALPAKLEAGGDPAEIAREAGLVSELMTEADFEDFLDEHFSAQGSDKASFTEAQDYLAACTEQRGSVAVVLAEGAIASGGAGGIDPDELAERLEAAADNHRTRSLVLRISTPGGDAFGAEAIREKLETIRRKGKPVIVSMGNAAASGGYWLALAADRIVADPLTVTGSIGVFSVVPDAAGALEKLDMAASGWQTSAFADFGSPLHKPNAAESALLRAGVMRTYARFKKLAADRRGKTLDEIEALAQGRVWMGTQAEESGLVDKLGDLEDAVKLARQMGGLSDDEPIAIYDAAPQGAAALLAGFAGEALAHLPAVLAPGFSAHAPDAAGLLRASGRPLAWAPLDTSL